METFSALLAICAGNSPVSGEFPAQRPVRRSFDVFFDLRLDGWLSKHSWGWWLETPSCPLWRQSNENALKNGGHFSRPQCVNTAPLTLQPTVLSPKTDNKEMTNHLDSDWQASTKSTRERNAVMLNNELIADVHFIVGSDSNQRRIPAHKYILVTGSSVFFAMFYGGLAEDTKEVSIPDVEPQAFLNLLKYVYSTRVKQLNMFRHTFCAL